MAATGTRQPGGSRRAQAVIELAIFGAVVLYLLGMIITQGAGTAYQQDAQLQSMRMALLSSHYAAASGRSNRNTASFMLLEDRLATGSAKYGPVDRMPFMAMGSGTMTKHLFKPMDWEDVISTTKNDIPVTDLRINGQHFVLRSGSAAIYRIRYWPVTGPGGAWEPSSVGRTTFHTGPTGATTSYGPWQNDGSRLQITQINGCGNTSDYCTTNIGCEVVLEDTHGAVDPISGVFTARGTGSNKIAKRIEYEWGTYGSLPDGDGYAPAYTAAVANDPVEWEKYGVGTNSCDVSDVANRGKFLRRYDLNRDGNMPDMCCPSPLAYVVWQWRWASLDTVKGEIDTENGTYPSWDVTGDLVEDTVYKISKFSKTCAGKSLMGYDVHVVDWAAGDLDTRADPSAYPNRDEMPGLSQSVNIKTTLADPGTYLEIRDGDAAGGVDLASSVNKKDQIDKIERKFVLNPRMLAGGSLCSQDQKPMQLAVEACCNTVGCCSTGVNAGVTCVEFPLGKTKILFIRSKIEDMRGRKWKTDTEPVY